MLVYAGRRGMVQGKAPYYWGEVEKLQKRVRIGVRDMDLEARVWRLVVVPMNVVSGRRRYHHQCAVGRTYPKSKSSTPNLLYFISTFRYMTGTSELDALVKFVVMSSTRSSGGGCPATALADSRAFSLRNFGAWMPEAVNFSDFLVFSA